MKNTKVVIIGGGPGGYETAIRLNQYGIDTILFEKENLGGVCLNWGCIPTKTMVKSADLFTEIKHAKNFGIMVDNAEVDYKKIYKRKNKVVKQLTSGVKFLFKKREIPVVNEKVEKISKTETGYRVMSENETIETEYIILATGSVPKELPNIKFDSEKILSSKDLLSLKEQPENLVVVGGGVVGSEFASIFAQLGTKVNLVEFLPNLVSTEDKEVSKRLKSALKKHKMKIHLKTAVEECKIEDEKVVVKLSNGKEIETDKVLLSVGRVPKIDIEFENMNLNFEKSAVEVDENLKTNLPNIYAIGDLTGKLMLAHTASKQGFVVADIIDNEINEKNHDVKPVNYENIPACIFTNPEIGSVGLTEEEASERFDNISVGKFPYSANGKSLGMGNRFGFSKVIVNEDTEEIVGMHIIGPEATELIAQGGILVGTKSKISDLKDVVFAHPTLSEVVFESLEDTENLSIHKI